MPALPPHSPLVISASRATDIPAFHGKWFMARLRAGFCRRRNPFNSRQESLISFARTRVFVFWSKHPSPFLPYLAEIAASRTRRIVKPFVELLAALPSVVIGFFGMVIVAPFLQDWFGADTGLNLLNAALMLAFMSVPTICSVAEDALFAVPRTLREASLALGATRWETLIRVVIPSALSGIGTAVMLGMSRAIGETMVVLMVAGGAAIIPLSVFDPVRPMPASIAAEMAEAPFRGDHYFALFATGIVLFLFTLLFNMLAFRIAEKHKQTGSSGL